MSDNELHGRVWISDPSRGLEVQFPCRQDWGYINLGRWTNTKVTQGDYTRDSDEILSSKIWTTFQGGIGIDHIREGQDEGRVWFSTLNMQHPYQLCLPPLTETVATVKYPLGDLNEIFYAADANQIFPVNNSTRAVGSALSGTIPAPVGPGVAFEGYLFIPCGGSGYVVSDATTATTVTAIDDVIQFLAWDETAPKLMALTSTGLLYQTSDGATWTPMAELNSAYTPRAMRVYTDRSDNEVIYIAHNGGLVAYDPITQQLISTRLRFPPHPDNARGVEVWRPGEDLFLTAGIGAYRFNLSAIAPMGLDRDHGLPQEYRGYFVHLAAEHNLLYGLVQGYAVVTPSDPEIEFDLGLDSESMDLDDSAAYSMLVAYNGFGWHPQWVSTSLTGDSLWTVVSAADGAYRLWWGIDDSTDGSLYTQQLSRAFANPRQQIVAGEGNWATSGTVDLGWFDANMREFKKRASHIEINMAEDSSTSADCRVLVQYKTDYNGNWYTLGEARSTGKSILPFAVRTVEGRELSAGKAFYRIRLRLTFQRGSDATQTPILDSVVLKYQKTPVLTGTYTISIPLDFFEEDRGYGPDWYADRLDELLAADGFLFLKHAHPSHPYIRVSLSMVNGRDRTGDDLSNYRDITVVEIPVLGYDGRSVSEEDQDVYIPSSDEEPV